jgi:hypothetical protein
VKRESKPSHTRPTLKRWQLEHTLAIVVIEAVFHAPMFALNAAAEESACEPSHTLAKSPHCMKPEPRRSDQRIVHRSVLSAECVRSDAAGARPSRCGATAAVGRVQPGIAAVLSLVRIIILEMSEARQKHAWLQPLSATAEGIRILEK